METAIQAVGSGEVSPPGGSDVQHHGSEGDEIRVDGFGALVGVQDADLKGKGMADRSGDCTGEEFNTAIGSPPLPTHVPF